MESVRKDFEHLIYQGMKSYGINELSSKLFAVLYSSPEPLTLDELSKMTGYSFSAVSAAMKLFSGVKFVEKTKKPGSKKLYFSMNRDILTFNINMIRSKNETLISPVLNELPSIIERCKSSKVENSEEILILIEDFYQQILAVELIYKKLIGYMEEVRREVNKGGIRT